MLHISEYDLIPVGEKEALKTWKKKSNRKGIKRKKKKKRKREKKIVWCDQRWNHRHHF